MVCPSFLAPPVVLQINADAAAAVSQIAMHSTGDEHEL
jgi:hypothetical protein